MWSTGILILCCVISFILGEFTMICILALFSVNKEGNNGEERKEKR